MQPTISRMSVRWAFAILANLLLAPAAFPADVQYVISLAVTESGDVYLADRNLPGVWKLQGEKVTLYFEGSRKFRTPLNAIRCVAVDRDGKLLAGDSSTRDIYRFDDQAKPVPLTQKPLTAEPAKDAPAKAEPKDEKKTDPKPTPAETGEKKEGDKEPESTSEKPATEKPAPAPKRPPALFGQIGIPMDIAVDKSGNLLVSDLELHRIVKVAKEGGEVKEFAQVQAPRGICLDAEDNLWVVSGRRLVKVSAAGEKTTVVDDGVFEFPHTVAVGADKTAYVCDGYSKTIWKVSPGGKPEKLVSGAPLENPVGMRLAGDKLLVVDPRAKSVFQVSLDGKVTAIALKAE